MHTFFTFTADLTSWQQQRVDSACRSFASVIDPGFDAEPLDLDGTRVGWFFDLTSDEAHRRLVVFFTELVGREDGRIGGAAAALGQDDTPVALEHSKAPV